MQVPRVDHRKELFQLGYLVPQFPGQTHTFFWREVQALRQLGIAVDLVSTRRPLPETTIHTWSEQVMACTTYLFPITLAHALSAVRVLVGAGPVRWIRCLRAIVTADAPASYRLKMLALTLAGAELVAVARKHGWTHVHVQFCGDGSAVAAMARLLGGITYSIGHHAALRSFGPAQKLKWRYAAFGMPVNRQLLDDLLDLADVPTSKLHIAPMGVDAVAFTRTQPYCPAYPGNPIRVVSCGRLHPGKGHQDVVAAVARLRGQGHDVRLEILGEGPARATLEALIAEYALAEHVHLRGAVDEGQVRAALERSHIFVLASHDEALGVATMEAMAMELPVVVTRVGGVAELVRDHQDGLLVPARAPQALASAIGELIRSPAQAVAMGRAGRERVLTSFSSRRSAEVLGRCLGVLPARPPVIPAMEGAA